MIFACCSCKKSTAPSPATVYVIDQNAVSIYYDQQHQFAVTLNGTGTASSTVSWKTSDTTRGKIDGNGLFKAKQIGTDTVTGTGQGFKVTAVVAVVPYYQLFQEPYFILNADTSVIKARETRKLGNRDESTITGEDRVNFTYNGENSNLLSVEYEFDNDQLLGVSLYLTGNNDLSFVSKLMTFYAERHPLDAISSPTYEVFYAPYSGYIIVDATNLDNIMVSYD